MQEKIFEDKVRTDLDYAKHLDNTFDFYDRSAKPEFAEVRNTINKWFDSYPVNEKHELKSRFKKTFSSAFFELFIYQLFTKQGFKLTAHPKLTHTDKTPDFLAEKGNFSFYIEAKEATDLTESEVAQNKKLSALYDAISTCEIPDFWLCIDELQIKGSKQPSGRRIIELIEAEAKKFTPEAVANQLELDTRRESRHIIIDKPKSPEIRGDSSIKPIGVYPMETFWGGPDESIRNAVQKKASRYGDLDKPYLLCINALSERGVNTISIHNALLGSVAGTWSTNPNNKDFRWERTKDGVFLSDRGPIATRVSGIFVTRVFPSNAFVAEHWLLKHPYCKIEMDCKQLDLHYEELQGTYWQNIPGKTISEILK
jgi:hypothetical protein